MTNRTPLIRIRLLVLFCIMAMQTVHGQVTVSGVVRDSLTKEPIEGIYVNSSGSPLFGVKYPQIRTDKNGTYQIICDSTAFLIFSENAYGGTIFEKIKGRTEINVLLPHKNYHHNDCTGKPVIYLYPPTPTEVRLKVKYNGKMETTYPAYNGGWKVKAEPDGTLYNKADGKEYSYLFWDGIKQYTKAELSYNTGFVVAADTALEFLQRVLPQMGLTPREYNEFIVYWLPFLQKNKLNFVHFRIGDAYNVISQNEVSPAPDTEIRVFMEFQAINTVIKVAPQHFTKPSRKGFTLVEWGGTEIKDEIFITKNE